MALDGILNLQQLLDATISRMQRVERWSAYGDRRCRENSAMHSLDHTFLGRTLYEAERVHGDVRDIDGFRLISALSFHDAGEGMNGDVRWDLKQHPILGPLLEHMERDAFIRDVIGGFPIEARAPIIADYDLQDDRASRTGRFFNAIEVAGYLLRSVAEYQTGGSRLLVLHVFAKQRAALNRHSEEFASIRLLRTHLDPLLDRELATPDGQAVVAEVAASRERTKELRIDDIRELLNVIPEAIRAKMLAALTVAAETGG
ncbi:MAG: HD domain-containing protein [bacterium]|nr:HD domain-containing protein [bacterium]